MKYFETAKTEIKNFEEYKKLHEKQYRKARDVAGELGRIRIVHVNTALSSGGVAEILRAEVPLERSLNLDSRWLVMQGSNEFFTVTKKIHNLLQGKEGNLNDEEKKIYGNHIKEVAPEFVDYLAELSAPKIVVLHDPQPLPLITFIPDDVPVISRLHIEITDQNFDVGQLLKPFVEKVRKIIISDDQFIANWIPKDKIFLSLPAIDPFNAKNRPMTKNEARNILKKIGLDPRRPIVSQISRFDPWKDPVGVIEAYKLASKNISGLQLVLAGLIVAEDDPEAEGIYNNLRTKYGTSSDIHLFGDKKPPQGLRNDVFINALQTGSDVIVQKSLREGFGLTVTEALFKSQPVIGGNVGGIKRQITDGDNGFLVASPRECAERIEELIKDSPKKLKMGKRAREVVTEKFLMSRLILDHLNVYREINRI